jgi:hypothetical protein
MRQGTHAGRGQESGTVSVLPLPSGRLSVASGGEVAVMSDGVVPARLLGAWEAAYRDYVAAVAQMDARNVIDGEVMAGLSARVAVTWRRLAASPGVAWWLVAVFTTAAEAFEEQARAWTVSRGRSC